MPSIHPTLSMLIRPTNRSSSATNTSTNLIIRRRAAATTSPYPLVVKLGAPTLRLVLLATAATSLLLGSSSSSRCVAALIHDSHWNITNKYNKSSSASSIATSTKSLSAASSLGRQSMKRAYSLPASFASTSMKRSSSPITTKKQRSTSVVSSTSFGLESLTKMSTSAAAMSDNNSASAGAAAAAAAAVISTTSSHPPPPQPHTHLLPPMHNFRNSLSNSWISHLSSETPENYEKSLSFQARLQSGGRQKHPGRPIYNGHYVLVPPTPLKNPKLVIHSPQVSSMLGIKDEEVYSEAFVKYFSGDVEGAFENDEADTTDADAKQPQQQQQEIQTWATPYALSIMGRRYTNNCPFGTGDGYGDGRAISVGEVLVATAARAINSNDESKEEIDSNDNSMDLEYGTIGGEEKTQHQHPLEHLYPHHASRYELQLKGAGQTPFCRGADGRAVLRSSIREFLASEAMHHLGISTTRALSLIVSEGPDGDTSDRMWYSSNNASPPLPGLDDPRLASYNEEQKREILRRLAMTKHDPDRLVQEKCAITTRVAPSFVRIGHLDLFARRVEMLRMREDGLHDTMEYDSHESKTVKATLQYQELKEMFWHACYREYYDEAYAPYHESKDATSAALALMEGAMQRIANMVAGWIRVGFIQGNFNADNCLIGGRTMDYGPFGFIDVYHPLSAKWTGSGEHFGFMNQPNAGFANYAVLVESLMPIIDANHKDVNEIRDQMLKRGQSVFADAVDDAIRSKLGLTGGTSDMAKEATELWEEIETLLRAARADWTLFWRQLTYVAAKYSPANSEMGDISHCSDYDGMLETLLRDGDTFPFYDDLSEDNRTILRPWIEKWHKALTASHQHAVKELGSVTTPPEEIMRLANPKYILKEWMLVDAYTKADSGTSKGNPFRASGDYSGVHELFELIQDPYGEGTAENHKKYYRRAPDASLQAGGTAFMS